MAWPGHVAEARGFWEMSDLKRSWVEALRTLSNQGDAG